MTELSLKQLKGMLKRQQQRLHTSRTESAWSSDGSGHAPKRGQACSTLHTANNSLFC